MRKNQGITLIELVITIIVLLILAGISIATLAGPNGILSKANTATEENKKAEHEEIIKLIGNGLRPEKVLENLSEADITFILEPAGYTNQNVTVEIQLREDIKGFTLQYSRDGNKWDNYTTGEKILYTENGWIHAKLINALEEEGGTASRPIDTIDREKPNEAIIKSSTSTDVETPIMATVTQTDKGNSRVDFTKCKWKYSSDSRTIGTNPSSYTGNFTKSPQDIELKQTTIGTYYLNVLTVDKAGNSRETIKGPITVTKAMAKVGVIVEGKNKEYEKNGTAIIPIGFAIVPGCDDVSQGLVISDVANDTSNTGNHLFGFL